MFKQIKEFFFGTPKETVNKDENKVEAVNAVPYKVEAPVTVEVAPGLAEIVDTTPVVKAPVKKQQFDKKPASATSTAKTKAPAKPRAPRKPTTK